MKSGSDIVLERQAADRERRRSIKTRRRKASDRTVTKKHEYLYDFFKLLMLR